MTKFCDTTNFMLYVLLESIDLMLLKLTRWAMKALGHLEDYLLLYGYVEQIG